MKTKRPITCTIESDEIYERKRGEPKWYVRARQHHITDPCLIETRVRERDLKNSNRIVYFIEWSTCFNGDPDYTVFRDRGTDDRREALYLYREALKESFSGWTVRLIARKLRLCDSVYNYHPSTRPILKVVKEETRS